jgi:hypothetical protein
LCVKCHREYDALKRYVDVIDDKLVVKVVNETDDETSDKYREWKRIVVGLKLTRSYWQEDGIDRAVEENGKITLYFVQNNPTKLPNRKALEFHKTSCLIWRMAGGAESDEEYCPTCSIATVFHQV